MRDIAVSDAKHGPAEERRRYLDWGVFHVEHAYLTHWRQYQRALRQRNAVLRQNGTGAEAASARLGTHGVGLAHVAAGIPTPPEGADGMRAAGGILGVMYTIPLRRALVTDSDLPCPEGVACAGVLKVGAGWAQNADIAAAECGGGLRAEGDRAIPLKTDGRVEDVVLPLPQPSPPPAPGAP